LRLESLEDRNLFSATPWDGAVSEPLTCFPEPSDTSAEVAPSSSDSSDAQDRPTPVLMVISNQDFWYQDYADTRAALEAQGLEVVVAATTTDVARPHANSGQGAESGLVRPDLALADVDSADYSAVVFVGGWGMAQYQYGFEGTYDNSAYRGDPATKQQVNTLIDEFLDEDKYVGAICYGVSVLAYARVDGAGLLEGREVTGWNGAAPTADGLRQEAREQIESTGARMFHEGSVGDPTTSTDDVVVDGQIITAQDWRAAGRFGEVIAERVRASGEREEPRADSPNPVLMVIANRDFYHREYYETRQSLEVAGLEVVVAAATTETAVPHAISVVEGREPLVQPDLALADVDAEDYSAIVFVGGYGAASYQYAFEGTYDNAAYRGNDAVNTIVNDLIGDFTAQGKYVTAICNGVTVLAWARVEGVSPLEGRQVAAWGHQLPAADGEVQFTREHVEANGARQFASQSIGNPATATDDVWVDGNIITAENYDSAYRFGAVIAERLLDQD
jgi:putative intracellular protease/amidase